ncbi:MAG: F0F1 ATP synthase subunit A [Bacteroidota bacterium]|nr:F0F1 ATP synthase subunit A [Bacteroidota bacterium]
MRKLSLFIGLLLILTGFSGLKAETKEAPLDAKKLIFSHIGDDYTWHITKIGRTELKVSFLVILYDKGDGWYAFPASYLEEGHSYKGFYLAKDGKYAGKVVEKSAQGQEIRPLDLSITKNVFALFFASAILLSIFLSLAGWYKRHPLKAPGGFVAMVESVIEFLRSDIKASVGSDYPRFQPYLLTAFFFILMNNLIGLIPFFPFGANVTGNIAVTFILAMFTMVIVNVFGTGTYWKDIFWPEVPMFLKAPVPLMPIIELFGVISKPFSLMVRLFANIMAGHTIMISLVCLIFFTVSMGAALNAGMTVLSVLLSVFMFFVELLVSFLQAYIFTLLSSVYIGLSRVKHD